MRRLVLVLVVVMCAVMVGCQAQKTAPTINLNAYDHYDVDTTKASFSDRDIVLSIAPNKRRSGPVIGFILAIENKSTSEAFLDWGKTYFLENGNARGGFMFEGVRFIDREASKPPLLILPGATHVIEVFPNSRVERISGVGWINTILKDGTFGMYATVTVGNREKRMRVLTKECFNIFPLPVDVESRKKSHSQVHHA